MNILLLAFAIPVATILLAIVLQKVLKCPLLVAATFFAVLLIITFAVFDSSFLVLAIIYTILAYITALLTRFICNLISRFGLENNNNCNCICDSTRNFENTCSRNSNSVSSGTWHYTTRNVPVIGTNQSSNNSINNNREENCNNNLNEDNESMIVLTNDNANNARNGRNCYKR